MKKEEKVITKEDSIEVCIEKNKKIFDEVKSLIMVIRIFAILFVSFNIIGGIMDILDINSGKITVDNMNFFRIGVEEKINAYSVNYNIWSMKAFELSDDNLLKLYSFEFAQEVIAGIVFCVTLYFVSKMVKEGCKFGTPFTENNSKYLKIINGLCTYLFLLGEGKYEINLTTFVIIEVILISFLYGNKLQQQVDETL